MTDLAKIDLPPPPKGIERDETEHGKLYYTRKQMIDFATRAMEHEPEYPRNSKAVDDFAKVFGFKK
jgi:hypothetical protein